MTKSILTAHESSNLILAAYKLVENSNAEAYLEKVEKIIVGKLFESSEIERALELRPNQD